MPCDNGQVDIGCAPGIAARARAEKLESGRPSHQHRDQDPLDGGAILWIQTVNRG